jgi:hypothetical protein
VLEIACEQEIEGQLWIRQLRPISDEAAT